MDDDLSRDHHWGLRIDALLPDAIFREHAASIRDKISAELPDQFEGFELRQGHVEGAGSSAPESLEGFFCGAHWGLNAPSIARRMARPARSGYCPRYKRRGLARSLGHAEPNPRYAAGLLSRSRLAPPYFTLVPLLLRQWGSTHSAARCSATTWPMPIQPLLALSNGRSEPGFLLNRRYFPYDKWLYPFLRNYPT